MLKLTLPLLALLGGCSTLNAVSVDMLRAGTPIVMCMLSGDAYVVQSGLPVPVGQRLPEADSLCAGLKK